MDFLTPDEERFAEKIRIEGECWIWQGALAGGYGVFGFQYKTWRAHRWAYEFMIGKIPAGLTLDHLCRNPSCANPFHCEPVTARENIMRGNGVPAVNARKTHCLRGHPLSGRNLYLTKSGKRNCRACQYLRRPAMRRQVNLHYP